MGRPHPEIPEEPIHRAAVVDLLLLQVQTSMPMVGSAKQLFFLSSEDAVRELIRHHVNLEARDDYGQTALIETVSGSIAEILIRAGSDINAKDKGREKPP